MTWTGMRRRPRRLVVVVVVLLALAVAVGGTAAFLMRAHASGASAATNNAATNTASRVSKDSVSGSLVSAPAFSKVAASGDTVVAVGSQDSAIPSFSVSTDGAAPGHRRSWAVRPVLSPAIRQRLWRAAPAAGWGSGRTPSGSVPTA